MDRRLTLCAIGTCRSRGRLADQRTPARRADGGARARDEIASVFEHSSSAQRIRAGKGKRRQFVGIQVVTEARQDVPEYPLVPPALIRRETVHDLGHASTDRSDVDATGE